MTFATVVFPALTRYNTVIALLTLGEDNHLADAVRKVTPKVTNVADLAGEKKRKFQVVEDELEEAIADFRDFVDQRWARRWYSKPRRRSDRRRITSA